MLFGKDKYVVRSRRAYGRACAPWDTPGRTGYGGRCPPVGRHRYFYRLFALDVLLPDLHEPGKAAIEEAMRGPILAEAALMGTYPRTVRGLTPGRS